MELLARPAIARLKTKRAEPDAPDAWQTLAIQSGPMLAGLVYGNRVRLAGRSGIGVTEGAADAPWRLAIASRYSRPAR